MQGRTRQIRCTLVIAAIVAAPFTGAWAAANGLQVENAWARATPPGVTTGAVYLTIDNTGKADELVGASCDVAATVEFHIHEHANGMMRMKPVASVKLGAGETVRFEPGGRHIMLIGLAHPLAPGDTLELTLRFASGNDLTVRVPVRDMRQ